MNEACTVRELQLVIMQIIIKRPTPPQVKRWKPSRVGLGVLSGTSADFGIFLLWKWLIFDISTV